MRALFSGCFDPLTNGHLNVIERTAKLFSELYVCVFDNSEKKNLFTPSERQQIISEAVKDIDNVRVMTYSGTVADFVKENEIDVIVKGVRSPLDMQYETEISDVNRRLCGVETVMLPTLAEYSRISSTVVREMIKQKKEYKSLVPAGAYEKMQVILKEKY